MMRKYILLCIVFIIGLGHVSGEYFADESINAHLMVIHYHNAPSDGQVTQNISTASHLANRKIGDLLRYSPDPRKDLTIYMGQLQSTIREQDQNSQILLGRRTEQVQKHRECLTKKDTSDREFFEGVKRGATDEVLESISSKSAVSGACAEGARVKVRSYEMILKQIASSNQALEDRYNFLRSNENFILNNLNLIDSDPTNILKMQKVMRQME